MLTIINGEIFCIVKLFALVLSVLLFYDRYHTGTCSFICLREKLFKSFYCLHLSVISTCIYMYLLLSADCHVMIFEGIFRDYAIVVSDHSIVPTDGSLCGCEWVWLRVGRSYRCLCSDLLHAVEVCWWESVGDIFFPSQMSLIS